MNATLPITLLVDNGSLSPEAILNLRNIAQMLSKRLGHLVHPVSLAYSDRVPINALEDIPAETLESCVCHHMEKGAQHFDILPFILAEDGGIAILLKRQLTSLNEANPQATFRLRPFLFNERSANNLSLATLLAERVRALIAERHLKQPAVILVDHGSPRPQAAYVRNVIAGQLTALLDGEIGPLGAASMERRKGEAYAFNEPLLQTRLQAEGFNRGDVIVALLFLAPGKHAGASGDIAAICAAAEAKQPDLRLHLCQPLGTHPGIIELLEKNHHAAQTYL